MHRHESCVGYYRVWWQQYGQVLCQHNCLPASCTLWQCAGCYVVLCAGPKCSQSSIQGAACSSHSRRVAYIRPLSLSFVFTFIVICIVTVTASAAAFAIATIVVSATIATSVTVFCLLLQLLLSLALLLFSTICSARWSDLQAVHT